MSEFTLHFDGSCWPNPGGTAAYGYTLDDQNGVEVAAESGVTGTSPKMSNNVAEFDALCKGFERTLDSGLLKRGDKLHVRGDSNLVIQIMSDNWRANADKLYHPYYVRAFAAYAKLDVLAGVEIDFTWIPRADNQRCDDLSKEHNHAPK